MKKIRIIILFNIFVSLILAGCCSIEPDKKRIIEDLNKKNSSFKLIECKNVETSPPLFIWYVEYLNDKKDTVLEIWDYLEKDFCNVELEKVKEIKKENKERILEKI